MRSHRVARRAVGAALAVLGLATVSGLNWPLGSSAISLVSPALAAGKTAAGQWKVGDKVDAWNITWYKATIIEIGSGTYAGYYKVHYEGYTNPQWLKADSIRARAVATSSGDKAGASSPRLGKYLIYAYGAAGAVPLFLGHFELRAGGQYRASRRSTGGYYGSGAYKFDTGTRTLKWLTGPFKSDKWGGKFSVEREGKTHRIELRSRTIAFNSTDAGGG